MPIEYAYTKSVNVPRLESEISQDPSITIAHSNTAFSNPDELKIFFKASLPQADKDALDLLVSNHINTPLDPEAEVKIDFQNKQLVHQTSRPLNTHTFFTSVDDNDVFLEHIHNTGDDMVQSIYADFNNIENMSFVHEASLQWKDAARDYVLGYLVPKVSSFNVGTNTDYKLQGGYQIIPADGDGDIEPVIINPVYMPVDQDSGLRPAAYWDFNIVSGSYDLANPIPCLDGDGKYNLFTVEVDLGKFAKKILMMGTTSAWNVLPSSDTAELGDGMRLKIDFGTRGDDHSWEACLMLIMHREKTL